MLMAVWTDLDGGVTHGPLHVVESAALDPGMTTQVAAAGGILMVIHWVNGRGTFLTRYNRAEQTRESVPLDRTRTFQRVSWDGATWFVCDVARRGAEDNQVFASRYSARGERLAPPVAIEDGSDDDNILTDCTIASSGGRALVGVGAYSNSRRGRQRVAGFACAEGAP